MQKDTRLWMKFPIDFDEHPKVQPLSDAAFRAFVEMNAYSRRQDLDGRVPVRVARTRWKLRALKELETNHPERPTLTVDGDVYVIHNYGEHQDTREDREAREVRNRTNGARGGRPKKNRTETDSVTNPGTDTEPENKQSQSQSQSQRLTDGTYLPESSHVADRANARTDLTEEVIADAQRSGVPDLAAVLGILEPILGPMRPRDCIRMAALILNRAKEPVRDPTAYIARAAERRDEMADIAIDILDIPVTPSAAA